MEQRSERQRYTYEAPEGGWGYLICLGMIIFFVVVFGVVHCFGFIFNDFLKNSGAGTGIMPVLNSFSFGATSIAGLLFHTLSHKFSKRAVGMVGAVSYCCATVLQLFAYSLAPLFIAEVLIGTSIGFMMPTIFSTFNTYFVKRRAFVMNLTFVIIGIIQTAVPIVVHYFLDNYGLRGCLLILVAISTHGIFGMLVMHPAEWHRKKIQVTNDISRTERDNTVCLNETSRRHQMRPLMVDGKVVKSSSVETSVERGGSPINAFSATTQRDQEVTVEKAQPWWKVIVQHLDLTLLKQPVYMNIVIGVTLAFYADLSFFVFLPLYLFELRFTEVDIARILAIGSAADLASRCVLAIVSATGKFNARYIFLGSAFCSIISRLGFNIVRDFWPVAILTTAIGFFRTLMHVPIPLIFTDYLRERFASGYGLFLFLQGLIMFSIGPISRYIRDRSNGFGNVLHFLNFLLTITVVVWLIEIVIRKCKRRNI